MFTCVCVCVSSLHQQTDVSGMEASLVVGPDGILRTTRRTFWISKNTRTRGEESSQDNDSTDDDDDEDDDEDDEEDEEEEEEWDENQHRNWAQDQPGVRAGEGGGEKRKVIIVSNIW